MGRRGSRQRKVLGAGSPLALFLRMLKWRRGTVGALAALALGLLAYLDHSGRLAYQGPDLARYDMKGFIVARVVDGDTLRVEAPDGSSPTTAIRFWGIDCPEIEKKQGAQVARPADPFGPEALAYTRKLAEGQLVRLRLARHDQRDKYNRLLAYIELPDGTILNERLLSEGLARAETRFSHEHMAKYLALERQAKAAKNGMWGKAK